MEIARGVRRLGKGLVNAYLVESDGEVTIVDAGAPSYWGELPTELAAMGRTLEDVRAVVLTHGHTDHIGFAERIRRERQTPVHVHEADALLARGRAKNPSQGLGSFRIRPVIGFLAWAVTHGLLSPRPIIEVITYGDGDTLDVPGAPQAILLPGHTPGSAALRFKGHDALFVGDAIATYSVTTGAVGPRIAPFTADPEQALASLERLDGMTAAYVLPGHGQAWTGGLAEAIRLVREGAVTRAA